VIKKKEIRQDVFGYIHTIRGDWYISHSMENFAKPQFTIDILGYPYNIPYSNEKENL